MSPMAQRLVVEAYRSALLARSARVYAPRLANDLADSAIDDCRAAINVLVKELSKHGPADLPASQDTAAGAKA